MTVTLANTEKHLVIVPLNSGRAVHLAPGERSSPIADIEVADNAKIRALVRRGALAVAPHSEKAAPKPEAPRPEASEAPKAAASGKREERKPK